MGVENLSLKLKVALFTLLLFLATLWGVTLDSAAHLREGLQREISAQQFATVSHVAYGINNGVRLRREALEQLAVDLRPLLHDRPALQRALASRKQLQRLFRFGLLLLDAQGRPLAAFPSLTALGDTAHATPDLFRQARQGRWAISAPRENEEGPYIIFSVPLLDNQRQLLGVLAGGTALYGEGLFEDLGELGSDFNTRIEILSPAQRVVLAASDPQRILQPLPEAGRHALLDRYLSGHQSSEITQDIAGKEVLASARQIPETGWVAMATLPTEKAFASVYAQQRHLLWQSLLISLLMAGLAGFLVSRELKKLSHIAQTMRRIAQGEEPMHTLELAGSSEIRQIQHEFNHLEQQLLERDEKLRDSARMYRAMFENNSAISLLIDARSGEIVDANQSAAAFYGWPADELRGMNISQIRAAEKDQETTGGQYGLHGHTLPVQHHRLASGEVRTVEVHSGDVQYFGRWLLYAIIIDVTRREQLARRERGRAHVLELMSRGQPLPDILLAILQALRQESGIAACCLLLKKEAGQPPEVLGRECLPPALHTLMQTALQDGSLPCSATLRNGQRTLALDIAASAQPPKLQAAAAQSGINACWSEPLLSSQKEVLGSLEIYWQSKLTVNARQIALIESFASLASIAIERRRNDASLALAATVFRASPDAIIITDADNRILAVNPAFTEITQYHEAEVLGRDPKLLSSGRQSKEFYREMWQQLTTTGQWHGEIINRRKDGALYTEWLNIRCVQDEEGRPFRRIAIFSDISEKKRTEAIIWQQANYDALTGLPNRRLFRDRLAQELKKAERDQLPLTLMFIDLDHFKEVNDTLGHEAGDTLLREAAQRISQCVRESDTLARLGGDEFTIILANLADPHRVEGLAGRIIHELARPFVINGVNAFVSASIGITLYPQDARDLTSLLKNADQAMYESKARGRNRYSYFTPSMQEAAQMRLQLSTDLRSALQAGQFELYYQPIIELASGRYHKAEALLRWHHPERGMVSPAIFIPLAEEIGLIHEIGDWVFHQAALKARAWHHSMPAPHAALQISVNKSPRQFLPNENSLSLPALITELGLPPHSIVVEITEGLLMDDRAEVQEKLLEFRDVGIQVSLDDFGTGYSAMSYLQRFDIDYIKIDQSFVRNMENNPNDQAIVEAIIVMAHKLGMKVVAEGVETARQRDMLFAAGCDYGQGYFFARPMPEAEFDAFMAQANAQPAAPGGDSKPA